LYFILSSGGYKIHFQDFNSNLNIYYQLIKVIIQYSVISHLGNY